MYSQNATLNVSHNTEIDEISESVISICIHLNHPI